MDANNPMDERTINKLIQRSLSWLNWVVRQGYYNDRNIFHGKSVSIGKGKNVITRQPFMKDKLKLWDKRDIGGTKRIPILSMAY